MNYEFLSEEELFDDEDDTLTRADKKGNFKSSGRKRKWREIESIKEQRRLRRDIESFEQYTF